VWCGVVRESPAAEVGRGGMDGPSFVVVAGRNNPGEGLTDRAQPAQGKALGPNSSLPASPMKGPGRLCRAAKRVCGEVPPSVEMQDARGAGFFYPSPREKVCVMFGRRGAAAWDYLPACCLVPH
jgi:hypothetical protein